MKDALIKDSDTPNEKFMDSTGEMLYWNEGTAGIHNIISKYLGEEKTRQQGWARAVYLMRTDENGKPFYNTQNKKEFDALIGSNARHSIIREYGMQIMGFTSEDGGSEWDQLIDDQVKNSKAQPDGLKS